MAHRACPLDDPPNKCKWCKFDPFERLERCSFYRGQIISGVPWCLNADKHHDYDVSELKTKALEIEQERQDERKVNKKQGDKDAV